MREFANHIKAVHNSSFVDIVDVVGTGGDGSHMFMLSAFADIQAECL